MQCACLHGAVLMHDPTAGQRSAETQRAGCCTAKQMPINTSTDAAWEKRPERSRQRRQKGETREKRGKKTRFVEHVREPFPAPYPNLLNLKFILMNKRRGKKGRNGKKQKQSRNIDIDLPGPLLEASAAGRQNELWPVLLGEKSLPGMLALSS